MSSPLTARALMLRALTLGPSHGLELIERVFRATLGAVRLGQGSAYPALRHLEHEGLVTSEMSAAEPRRGGRARVVYTLTSRGNAQAAADATVARLLFANQGIGLTASA